MAVHPLIEDTAFEPETISLISRAYEASLGRLGARLPAAVKETLAERIIGATRRGERDIGKLTAGVLRGLHSQDDRA